VTEVAAADQGTLGMLTQPAVAGAQQLVDLVLGVL